MTGETTKRFLALDIGDLYFKFAFFEKKAQQLRAVLWGAEELSAIFWRRPLERIWPTIQQKYVSWKKEESSVEKVILTFSPSIFKAVLMPLGWERKNPQSEINKEEEQSIEKGAFHKTEEKMKEILFKSHGIAASDFVLQNLEILTMSIDGYRVSHLQGFKGTAIEFQFLGTFLPLEYAQRIQSLIFQYQLGKPVFIHEVQLMHAFAAMRKKDALFIDLGDKITQIAVVKGGELLFIKELAWGGDILTRHLEDVLGMKENIAREFKEQYAAGKLSEDLRKKVRELFLPEVKKLVILVEESMEAYGGVLPLEVLIFGGGSLLPELIESFKENDFQNLPFIDAPQVGVLLPKDIAKIENFSQALNPLYTTLFLEYYATQ